jgi:hypothetical protein
MPLIETIRGPVTVAPEVCDVLLDKLRSLKSGRQVVRAFEKAGLGDPVALDLDGRRVVVEAVSRMLEAEEVGEGEVDPQLRKLAGYLRDELPEE